MSGVRERRKEEVGVQNLDTMKLSETFTNLNLYTYLTSSEKKNSQEPVLTPCFSNPPNKDFVSILMLLHLSANTPGELNTDHVLNFYYVDLPFDLFNSVTYLTTYDFPFCSSPLPNSCAFHKSVSLNLLSMVFPL